MLDQKYNILYCFTRFPVDRNLKALYTFRDNSLILQQVVKLR